MSRESREKEDGQSISLQPPRGTHDLLPGEIELWQRLESTCSEVVGKAGYKEVRVPVFEHTELFKRGVGETTDIVNKEMYTFTDKSDRSLTLRPEGTAGVVRAYLNGGLHRQSPPVKLWYAGPMFRYERTQAGRQRQFHQLGIEVFGAAGPLIDAEVIVMAVDCLAALGIGGFELQLNSIGCPACRPAFRELLRKALAPMLPELCEECRDRFDRNPLRMLDCKSPTCQAHYKDVPASLDHLCAECSEHWQGLVALLGALNVAYSINKRLVRGLDYYTRTVMEVVSNHPKLGAQSTICAGGRYDHLVEAFNGAPTPAVGWAMGLERLCLILEAGQAERPMAFVVSGDPERALATATTLRRAGISCDLDFPQRGLPPRNFGKQLQQSNKCSARFSVILGDDELALGEASVKDMVSGHQERVPLSELVPYLQSRTGEGD